MGSYQYPADFQLAAAMNPCRCGHYPDRSRCTCTDAQIRAYLGKVSRPLLDRIDICVEAAPVSYEEISSFGKNEDSATIRKRVEEARRIQTERFKGYPIRCNAQMSGSPSLTSASTATFFASMPWRHMLLILLNKKTPFQHFQDVFALLIFQNCF